MIKRDKLGMVIYFITGFFGFSILGQYILLQILHFPVALMEIYYISLLFWNSKDVMCYVKKIVYGIKKGTFFLIAILLLSFMVTLVMGGDAMSIRPMLYLVILSDYFTQKEKQTQLINIYIICLSAVLGEVFFRFVIDTNEMMSSMNCIALSACIFIPYCFEMFLPMCISIIGLLLFSINTGYRIGIIVVLLSTGIILIHMVLHKKMKNQKLVIEILFTIILVTMWLIFKNNYLGIINAFADMTNMSSFARFRVTARLQGLLEGDTAASQDSARWNMYKLIFTEFLPHIIPKGVTRLTGDYIDVPMIFLYDVFGSLLSVVILFALVLKEARLIVWVLKNKATKVEEFVSLEVLVLIFLLIVNGTYLKSVYQAIMAGTIIGILLKREEQRI